MMRPRFGLAVAALPMMMVWGCGRDKALEAPPTKEVTAASQLPLPAYPAWSKAFMGKTLDVNAKMDGDCKGAFDVVKVRHRGPQPGVEVEGWSWLEKEKQPAAYIVFADPKGLVSGAGETRVERPDVKAALPEVTETKVGWHGAIGATSGVFIAFAVKPDSSVCRLLSKDIGADAS